MLLFDISKFSRRFEVLIMRDADADVILELCRQNPQFYQYCGRQPSRELVLNDLHVAPPGMDASSKYYVGFYERETLFAVMDLIDGYPNRNTAYIGFFMMNRHYQGRHIGSGIIAEVCLYLKDAGMTAVRLAIDKGNPQSNHFWKKNGFHIVKEVERDGQPILVAERQL